MIFFRRVSIMISGGNATIIVANMDHSIRFYTEVLGLQLTNRFGNDWATVSAGEGLTIGIHPASPRYPHPGTKGSILLGLDIDVPIEKALSRLVEHGVEVKGGIVRSEAGNFAHLEDPDGNEIYLWEKTHQTAPEVEMTAAAAT
jgi:predicted enzyme related to lactoylglutathione lyase